MLRIGIVAGEASGDLLGAGLMRAIQAIHPTAEFFGIAGPEMEKAGCRALYQADRLAVMGFTGVFARLPELLRIRRTLKQLFIENPPDIFIGIDAPDFNLPLERALREEEITTVHYVSPSVWAWRRSRLPRIARSVDLMLTLFPFEADFYHQHDIPVKFVGHPLAEIIPEQIDNTAYQQQLALPQDKTIVALLPGSRRGEVGLLATPLVETAQWCLTQRPDLHFVVPFASAATREIFEQATAQLPENFPMTLVEGHSRDAMAAADVVVLASGTATLEALLLKKPMVVVYRLGKFNYWLAKRLLKVKYYSLPNNLTETPMVREITQEQVRPDVVGPELLSLLDASPRAVAMQQAFASVREQLQRNASKEAARAIMELVE